MKNIAILLFSFMSAMKVVGGGEFKDIIVAPGQISTQNCVLAIRATTHDELGINFEVCVNAKRFSEDIRYSNNCGAHLQFRRGALIVLHCALRPASVNGDQARFWFRVPKDSLSETYFAYATWPSSGYESTRYVFSLAAVWNHSGGEAKVPKNDSWTRRIGSDDGHQEEGTEHQR